MSAQLFSFIETLSRFIAQLLNFIDIKHKKGFTHKTVRESFNFIMLMLFLYHPQSYLAYQLIRNVQQPHRYDSQGIL